MNKEITDSEIWSNFFLVKNKLMEYNENLNDSLSAARMLMKRGQRQESSAVKDQLSKAHRHVGLVFHIGMNSLAIPLNAPAEDIEKIRRISRGEWKDIKDLEYCQDKFTEWFRYSGLYDVTIKKIVDKMPL